MKPTEIAAWWVASIAMLVLFWDIYKWIKTGPRLSFKVSSNMKVFGGIEPDNKKYVTVRVTNNGNRSTTITNMEFAFYKSWFHHLIRKVESQLIISKAGTPHPLPFELKPGSIWDGASIQNDEVEQMATSGYLECQIFYSNSMNPKKKRVKIKESSLG